MVEHGREEIPMLRSIDEAVSEGWSGLMRVLSRDEQIGVVVVKTGRIAWAVCKYQREDLGTFLLRRGHVSAEQLSTVRARYEALGKTRKLASLLEEAGIADRSTLRHALMLHIRRALSCMLSVSAEIVTKRDTELKVDEDMTFSIDELLPEFGEDDDPAFAMAEVAYENDSREISANPDVLAELASIPGFRSAVLASTDGRFFAGHGAKKSNVFRALGIGVPSSWLESSTQSARVSGLGTIRSAVLEGEFGVLVTYWLFPEEGIFLAVILDENARVGVAKHRIASATPAMEEFIAVTLAQNWI